MWQYPMFEQNEKLNRKHTKVGITVLQIHKPFDSIDVTDSNDLEENNEQQGESGSIIIEHSEPVIPWRGGEAQAEQQTEQTH